MAKTEARKKIHHLAFKGDDVYIGTKQVGRCYIQTYYKNGTTEYKFVFVDEDPNKLYGMGLSKKEAFANAVYVLRQQTAQMAQFLNDQLKETKKILNVCSDYDTAIRLYGK